MVVGSIVTALASDVPHDWVPTTVGLALMGVRLQILSLHVSDLGAAGKATLTGASAFAMMFGICLTWLIAIGRQDRSSLPDHTNAIVTR
jgi:hypothetical protein